MTGPTGCFFLDSNIAISEILKENNPRISKFKSDSRKNKICCYISDSIKNEVNDKVTTTINYLGNVVKTMIQLRLEESRRNRGINLNVPITTEDIHLLEDVFSSFHQAIKRTNGSLQTPISVIEEWTITFLAEKLDSGTPIDIHNFILQLTMKLLDTTSDIQNMYDDLIEFQNSFLTIKNIVPNPTTVISLNTLGLHKPDDYHVASAYSHQQTNSQYVVFVTFDYKTILKKRYDVRNAGFSIKCSDPLYAIHHLQ